MAYIQNFESDEHKHIRMENAPKSNYNPLDYSTVTPTNNGQRDFFSEHIKQYTEFISWARWFPDLFLDLIKPKKGGINLHFDQRVFLRIIGRFSSIYGVFPRGWGKCVSKNTYLFTNKGIIKIKDLFSCEENGIEDYTKKIDMKIVNKNQEHESVSYGVYNGYKKTKIIKTNFGFELECSCNHPVLIKKRTGDIDFVLAKDLRKDDEVIISLKNNIWGNNIDLNLNGYNYTTEEEIPECVMTAKKNIIIKILQRIFDENGIINDNNEIFLKSKSKEFIKQVQLILLNLGIISKVDFDSKNFLYYLRIFGLNLYSFRNEIGFSCSKKKNKLDKILNILKINKQEYKKKYFFNKIVEIEDSENHVYDISVPDTHSFVSNGFISHNTWGEVISMFITAILYPGINLALTAQTKANAAELLKDKYDEIVEQYPLMKNEIMKFSSTKDDCEIRFVNGSRIDVLANAQSSKGQRRHRIEIEESALLDNETYEDALAPIVEIGRPTQGDLGIIDPIERNQQINFFTTSGFRGSDEWARSVRMYKDMLELKGEVVLGSGWQLGCWMGRGSDKLKILKKKKSMGATAFARNYEEKWVGAVDHQLVDINKLLKTRSLTEPVLSNSDNKREIVLGVDVARSANNNNNKTVISVIEEHHADNGLIRRMDLINMFLVSNQLNFTAQACLVKRIQMQYNAKMVVVDTNGLGNGLRDELLKPNVDVQTGDSYLPWDAVNGEIRSEYKEAIPIFFALNSQNKDETKKDGRINSYAIINFIDCVEGNKLRLLEEKKDNNLNLADIDAVKNFVPFQQTNALVEEISNLKLKHLTNGEITVEKVLSRVDKDRFSSLIYGLWWIMTYDNKLKTDDRDLVMTIARMNKIGSSTRSNSLNNLFM